MAHVPNVNGPEKGKKQTRGGMIDLEQCKDLHKLKGSEKLSLLLVMEVQVPESTSELTEGARSFVKSTLHPILNCLKQHFGCCQDEFM